MIWDLERGVLIPRSRSFHGNPASRTYVIAILNIVFFPNPVSVPKFRRIPLCGWQSNPYPFNVSRIPHCLLVKFRDPGYTLHVRCQFNSSFFFSWFRKSERPPVMGREWVNIYFFNHCCLGRLGWSRRCWLYYGDQSVIQNSSIWGIAITLSVRIIPSLLFPYDCLDHRNTFCDRLQNG